MSKVIALLTLFSGLLLGQNVADVAASITYARTSSTIVATITATLGDGTICQIIKLNLPKINARLQCTSADGKSVYGSAPLTSTSTATWVLPFGYGDVTCLLGVNPTASPVTMGGLGSIPSNGIGWSCTTNISGSGQTPLVNGSVTWP